jgi:hypothetical protein
MTAGLLALLVAAHPVIASSLDCPSARDIASQLSVLLPETAEPGSVVVSASASGLLVDLRPDDATFAALRTVSVGEDCDERARATAVVISTWWPVPGRARPQPEALATVAPAVPVAPRARRLGLGAGAFASLVSDGAAAGGRIEASWLPPARWGGGWRASLAYTGSHTSEVSGGAAGWSRATLEVGPSYSLGHGRLDLGAVASRLWINGTGYAVNQTSQGSSFGVTAGGRLEHAFGRVVPWLEARGFLWPQTQHVYVVDGSTAQRTSHIMPHTELQLGGGIAMKF